MNMPTKMLSRLFATSAFALLSACGGGGGDGSPAPAPGPAPAPTPAPAPAPAPAVSLKDRVMLFVVPSGVSSSSYLPDYDVTVTNYKQFLYRLVPELDRRELLDSTSGTSYQQWHINTLGADDRFFVRHDWRQFEVGGYHDMKEYGPDAQFQRPVQPPAREWRITKPAADGCSAVAGDWYYYRSRRNHDILRGDVGGEFYRYNIVSGQEQLLLPFNSPQNCHFHLMSSGGALYDMLVDEHASEFRFYRRDLTTGAETQVAVFTEPSPTTYENAYRFAMEAGVLYIARRRLADGQVEIYSYDLNEANPQVKELYNDKPAVMDIFIELDVDDGHLMLASQNGTILMLDLAARTQQVLDLGVKIGSITQVLVK